MNKLDYSGVLTFVVDHGEGGGAQARIASEANRSSLCLGDVLLTTIKQDRKYVAFQIDGPQWLYSFGNVKITIEFEEQE